jgi:hypothetical protein
MDDNLVFEGASVPRRPMARPAPTLVLLAALLTVLISAGVCAAAILDHAPAGVVPLVVVCCIGCPLFAGCEVPVAVASLRARRTRGAALAALRRTLDWLPETEHPLGL